MTAQGGFTHDDVMVMSQTLGTAPNRDSSRTNNLMEPLTVKVQQRGNGDDEKGYAEVSGLGNV